MVGPAGCRYEDFLAIGVETGKKFTTDSKSSGPGNRLSNSDAILFNWNGIWAVGQNGSSFCEGRYAGDAGIFFV